MLKPFLCNLLTYNRHADGNLYAKTGASEVTTLWRYTNLFIIIIIIICLSISTEHLR